MKKVSTIIPEWNQFRNIRNHSLLWSNFPEFFHLSYLLAIFAKFPSKTRWENLKHLFNEKKIVKLMRDQFFLAMVFHEIFRTS